MTARTVLSVKELTLAASSWRSEGAVIVLASGCFDPLHLGHVQHFEAARKLGNVLVVGVASDRIVKEYKQKEGGPPRPFMPAIVRAGIVGALKPVDCAVINDGPCELIAAIHPHVYVKGSEYRGKLTPDLEAELELLTQQGGKLEFVSGELVQSSSAILAATQSCR